jgi:UDP-N-acetylglucosamine--N-acetylmuramyl-(pentapeptide) pyrophosphoryl-undecaprenol N-acetylglucosamine transferase
LSGAGTRGDQVENARYVEQAGAAVVLSGAAVNAENLAKEVTALAEDAEKRDVMAAASRKIGSIDGAGIIAESLRALTTDCV